MLQIIIIILLVAADQLSKFLLWPTLPSYPGSSMPVIPDVLHFSYVKNEGASFGIFQGAQVFFIIMTIIVLIAAVYIMIRYRDKHNRFIKVLIAVLFAGALGNLIDRIAFGYVRDFIDFRLFSFWTYVFNIADAALVVGAILLAVYILFFYKDKKKPLERSEASVSESESPEGKQGDDDGGTAG
jgi:signal peptidase II